MCIEYGKINASWTVKMESDVHYDQMAVEYSDQKINQKTNMKDYKELSELGWTILGNINKQNSFLIPGKRFDVNKTRIHLQPRYTKISYYFK